MIKEKGFTSFDWVLLGIILHAFGELFFESSKIICYILCGLGLFIVFYNVLLKKSHCKPFRGIIRLAFYLHILWSVIIIIRPLFDGAKLSMDGFSLINRYTLLSYITPVVVYFTINHLSLRSVFRVSYICGFIGIVLLVKNYSDIFLSNLGFNVEGDEYQVYIGIINIPLQFLSIPSFMALCYSFVATNKRMIAYLTLFLSVFIALFAARRSNLFMSVIFILFALYLYIIDSTKGSRILKLIFVAAFVVGIILAFDSYSHSTFSFFLSRLDEDTRSGMEESLFNSFKGKALDWIIGRGINGSYFCSTCGIASNRGEIETGYLFIILKGGVIYLASFVFLLAHSAYIGLFKTKNMLTKAMALNLLAHILFLYPSGIPAFDLEYIIVWVCICFCQSKQLRMYTNFEIVDYLELK